MADPYYRYGAPPDTGGSAPRPGFPGYLSSGAHSSASHGTLGSNDLRGASSDLIRRDYPMNPLWHGAYGADDMSGARVHSDRDLGGLEPGASMKAYPLHSGSHGLDDISGSRAHSDMNGMVGTRAHSDRGFGGFESGASVKAHPLHPESHGLHDISGSGVHYEAGFGGLATGAGAKVYSSQPESNGLDAISGARLYSEPGFGGFASGTSTKAYPLQPGARGLNDISGSQVQSNLSAGGFASGTSTKAYPLQPGAHGLNDISDSQGLASRATLKSYPLKPVDDISGSSQVHSEADKGGLASGASTKGYPSLEDPKSLSQRRDVSAGVPDMISERPSSLRNNGGVQVSGESNVLFVDGLPNDCTRREVGHLFRPFIGFEEIRVVHKEPRRSGDRAMVLCFVEFTDSKCALTALEALQGYKFDDKKPDSSALRIHFAHFPFRLPTDNNEKQIETWR